MGKADSFSNKPKKVGRPPKVKGVPLASESANLLSPPVEQFSDDLRKTIDNIIQNGAGKYAEIANNQRKQTRNDFDVLQPIVSEFLENFIIIGHTLDGQRIVARYTKNPAGLDGLTELCKRVLVQMMVQESQGTVE